MLAQTETSLSMVYHTVTMLLRNIALSFRSCFNLGTSESCDGTTPAVNQVMQLRQT